MISSSSGERLKDEGGIRGLHPFLSKASDMPRGTKRPTPTQDQLRAAYGKNVPDVIASDLRILFVGINPSLYSAAVGHHFARPGNRFWPALHGAGFTDRLLAPSEERILLDRGCGITNIVNRATARADELTANDLSQGIRRLEKKVRRFRPRCVVFLGISAYQAVVDRQSTSVGPQTAEFGGARVWLLPNPSGLNAHYQLAAFVRLFRDLQLATQQAG
jgi:double-stranded uracil-DNA glycosylase